MNGKLYANTTYIPKSITTCQPAGLFQKQEMLATAESPVGAQLLSWAGLGWAGSVGAGVWAGPVWDGLGHGCAACKLTHMALKEIGEAFRNRLSPYDFWFRRSGQMQMQMLINASH